MNLKKTLAFFLIISYKLLLDYSYITYVNPYFSYQGFILDFNLKKYISSTLIIILFSGLFIKESNKFSLSVLNIYFLLMLIPLSSLYALENQETTNYLIIVISFIITMIIVKTKTIKISNVNTSKLFIPLILGVITFVTYGALFIFNGLPSLTALNLLNVYEVRSSVNYGPLFFPYLFTWQAKVINPLLIGIGILNKKKRIFFIGVFLQFIIYIYTGHKSYIFTPFLVIVVGYAIKQKRMLVTSLIGLNLLTILSLFVFKVANKGLIASLFIRRTMFIPMKNYYYYFDFFNNNPKLFLAHSIFEPFISPRYSVPVQNLIGATYYNNPNTWVNAGYLADAYANFGVIGALLFGVLLGFLLKTFDSLSSIHGIELVTIASFVAFFSLLSGALLTTLLTGGILFSLLILIFLNSKRGNLNL